MKWFIAKMIFRIIVSDETKSQFDIQLRLILAPSLEKALVQIKEIGYSEEEIFSSANNKTVEWKFIDVESISELPELNNGTLMHSFTQEEESAADFINSVKTKSQSLTEKQVNTFASI